ncbi:MAG TPA: glycosyltransferase family 2 protein [Candidatus Levybacteria bacterium]|nr:glycosyltransferase family 2 protein [Candidatus Levybacteria bacterium]
MISVIIISYNEEDVLEEALKSIHGFADEIILVDSGSKDKTLDIAKKYQARVVSHTFKNFSDQRNFGFEHSKGNWIFYLDSDERITDAFKNEVLQVISSYSESQDIAGYYIKRKTFYFGKDWGLTDSVQRLFYRKKFIKWFGDVHETPRVKGDFGIINTPIIHKTHRNLSQMVEKTNKWSEYEAHLRFTSNHPYISWWRFPRVMIPEFFRAYISNKGYKNGTMGLIESIYQAFSIFITYAKVWEQQVKK